jgi:hypothetical protein
MCIHIYAELQNLIDYGTLLKPVINTTLIQPDL